jgi:cell division protein FtsL
MSKLDAIRARIAFHEKVFFAAMAAVLALVGWTVNSYLSATILCFLVQQELQWLACQLLRLGTIRN